MSTSGRHELALDLAGSDIEPVAGVALVGSTGLAADAPTPRRRRACAPRRGA
ncbi:MAG: hypothetical protein ACRDOE_00585 [Streptosporangiaceae bacterium]